MPNPSQRLLLRNGTIVTAEREIDADILIEGNHIRSIFKRPYEPRLISQGEAKIDEEIDCTGMLLFPGLIDGHVHFREPGLEQKETLATGAAAALAGGVTTVCEMPNTIPPTVTVAALADKVKRADKLRISNYELRKIPQSALRLRSRPSPSGYGGQAGQAIRNPQSVIRNQCDVRFFFGATEPQHLIAFRKIWLAGDAHMKELKARCCGLKLYFDHSTGNQKAGHGVIEEAFKLCGELGAPVVCHCEDARMNDELRIMNYELRDIMAHSKIRPPESEEKAIRDALRLAKKYGTHVHVAHLSTKSGLGLIRAAKKSGIAVTCEIAPHHLFLTVDDYASLGTLAKMNPPLRTQEHQEALWQGIADGTVDCIATDHAPHTSEEKHASNPLDAPSGVPGVETMLPLLLTVASGHWPHPTSIPHSTFHIPYSTILRLCFTNPNRIFDLGKQGIAEGAHGDLIIIDPAAVWTITGGQLHSKCGWTPYEGWQVFGKTCNSML